MCTAGRGLELSSTGLGDKSAAFIQTLTQLRLLSLSLNVLSSDWTVVVALSTLTSVDLSGNRLVGSIPSTISQLTAVATLDLSGNMLSGSVPPSLSLLPQLRFVRTWANGLRSRARQTFTPLSALSPWL